ncbi:MAG: hypothetical protein LAQ69_49085 [Acidobacteriia bacterium]|nr:hypothetical protein [Terriglobia bacterium]
MWLPSFCPDWRALKSFRDSQSRDQAQLYFAIGPDYTSTLSLRTVKPPNAGSVFRYTPNGGVDWFAPKWGPVRGIPDVSADGSVIAVSDPNTHLACTTFKNCDWVTTYTGRIVAPGLQLDSLDGRVQLSRNGRYALLTGAATATVIDLVNGVSRTIQEAFRAATRQAITRDGAVLLWDGRDFVLDRNGTTTRFTPLETPDYSLGIINDLGTRIVYTSANGNLRTIDLDTGDDIPQAKGAALSISADGQTILFRGPQVSTLSPGGPIQQLTFFGEYVNEAILSPDGAAVYATTGANRIVQISLSDHSVTEIVARTPAVYPGLELPFEPVPGSLATVFGSGLSDEAAAAQSVNLPLTLSGASIKIGDFPAPLRYASPSAIDFQVPFEAPPGPVGFYLASESPFYQLLTINLPAWYFRFLQIGPELWTAIHQDFRSFASLDDPVQPGEIIHFYAVGLGPVSPPVATGAPGPSDPPAVAVTSLQCTIRDYPNNPTPLAIRFAGLAPGLYGVYQISVQLPDVLNKAPGVRYIFVECGSGDQQDSRGVPVPEN